MMPNEDPVLRGFHLSLTALSLILILLPSLVFQNQFSQGDHGRDLYAFAMSARGALPYRDYFWVYGPLMPLYYAFFLKVVAFNILSILIGETLLKLTCGLLFLFIMNRLTAPLWASLCSIFFLSTFSFFFHTYTYTGGILLIFCILYVLIRYLHEPKVWLIYAGALCVFLLSLVKLNIGVGVWICYMLSVVMIDRNSGASFRASWLFYTLSFVLLPLLTFSVYRSLLAGLPDYVVRQCIPFSTDLTQWAQLPSVSLRYLWSYAIQSPYHMIIVGMLVGTPVIFLVRVRKAAINKQYTLALLTLFIFIIFLLHEYYFSAVPYRVIWAVPVVYLMSLAMLWSIAKSAPRPCMIIATGLLMGLIVFKVAAGFARMSSHMHPEHFLALERGGIFVGNDPAWVQTVRDTTRFMDRVLAKDELFFALPYEPLYYFLLDKRSPTYQTVFFDYINMPLEQESQTIKDLEKNGINWIIYSNRIMAREADLGVFGRTHSQSLFKYLEANFGVVQQLGAWDREPGWNSFHGIRIARRIRQ